MKLIKFTPSRSDGAILGEAEIIVNVPTHILCNIVKTKTGTMFASMPSNKYTNKDGEIKYKQLVFFDKEIAEKVNKEIVAAYNDKDVNLENPF
jgi:hypothetical protein